MQSYPLPTYSYLLQRLRHELVRQDWGWGAIHVCR